MRIYVGNLAVSTTEEDVISAFKSYKISEVDLETGHKTAFAILKVADGERAVKDMNGTKVGGNLLRVVPAVDREKQAL